MAGLLVNVLPKTTFDFADIANGTSPVIPLGNPVLAIQYTNAGFVARVHSTSIAPANSISVGLYEDGFLEDSIQFVPPLNLRFLQDIDSTTPVPSLLPVGIVDCGVSYVTVALTAQRVGPGALIASISIDVLLKSPDDSTRPATRAFYAEESASAGPPAALPAELKRNHPHLGALRPLLATWGLNVDSVRFAVRRLPEGFAAQTESGHQIALSPTLVASKDARAVFRTLGHEFAHVTQIRRLGLPMASARALREEELLGQLGTRRVGRELREKLHLNIDPVDPRFTLEAIAGRMGEIAQHFAPPQGSAGTSSSVCATCAPSKTKGAGCECNR